MTPSANSPEEKQPPRVSVVVVSHNRAEMLRRCLKSIEAAEAAEGRGSLQVIVVDNGSTDGAANLASEFPDLQWVRLPKNFGLTKAWNIGWRAADAAYVYFLHDDTEVEAPGIMRLANVLDANTEAAAAIPLLVDGSGNPSPQLGTLPPDGEWRAAQPTGDDLVPVEYPRGAALMVRVFNIKAIRQIDERYGQFGADADLATQIRRASRKILLAPDARVRHDGRKTYTPLERADFQQARSVFMSKYFSTSAGFRVRMAAVFGAFLGGRLSEAKHAISGQKIDGTQG